MGLMKGNRSLFIAVGVVAVLILGWWFFGRGGRFAAASPDRSVRRGREAAEGPGVFAVGDVTINGETKKAIAVEPTVGTPPHLQDARSPTMGG